MVTTFRSNLESFSESINQTYKALNKVISKYGVSYDIKNLARGIYLTKINYFNLQKEHLKTIRENLINDEFYEIVDTLSVIDNKIESSIKLTQKEIDDLNN